MSDTEPGACPECGVDDNDALMGHVVRGVYDGVLFWSCLDCGCAWPREHALPSRNQAAREYAKEYMGEPSDVG